jgi:hypothetical protein
MRDGLVGGASLRDSVLERMGIMSVSYLKHQPWSRWSREERLFCAVLFEHARRAPAEFAKWLIVEAKLGVQADDTWDLGFEVRFYREFLWQQNRTARVDGLPPKRTFDLCLFGERAVIVIEAKVCEAFGAKQNTDIGRDKGLVRRLIGRDELVVNVVAIASSKYFETAPESTLDVFDGRVTWAQVARRYPDPLLAQADGMYRLEPGQLLGVVHPQPAD